MINIKMTKATFEGRIFLNSEEDPVLPNVNKLDFVREMPGVAKIEAVRLDKGVDSGYVSFVVEYDNVDEMSANLQNDCSWIARFLTK
jgi:hypothetical protein